jgi:hypothetical protein
MGHAKLDGCQMHCIYASLTSKHPIDGRSQMDLIRSPMGLLIGAMHFVLPILNFGQSAIGKTILKDHHVQV